MRRCLVLASLVALIGGLGCTEEDPAPLFMDINYQVRCLDCEPRANDDPERDIHAVDGEKGLMISCSLIEREGERVVTFSAQHLDENNEVDYGLTVVQASLDSGDPGTSCRVQVKEGGNNYEGRCTNSDPTDEQPCEIDLDTDGDVVTGTLYCLHIPNKSQTTVQRNLVTPNGEDKVKFEVHGCGL